jgi:hypothetical protein
MSPRTSILDSPPQTNHSRSSSIGTTSSSSDSGRNTASPRKQPQQPTKPSTIRGFFSVKEPSALAFEQLAKQQRAELAQKGQCYPTGVPRGQLPSNAAQDHKNRELAAKKTAKRYEMSKIQAEKRKSMPSTYNSPPAQPVYRTLDPAQRRSSYGGITRSREITRTESYHTPLDPVAEIADPRPSISASCTRSIPSIPSHEERRRVAPWEEQDEELSTKKQGFFAGFGRR